MTFSYAPFATDRDRVRFHLGDVDGSAPVYSDETLDAVLIEAGTWQAAVILCIDGLIAQLAGTPNFTADWLKVDVSTSLKAYQQLRGLKLSQLGLESSPIVGTDAIHVYRLDSEQLGAPTYDGQLTWQRRWNDAQ